MENEIQKEYNQFKEIHEKKITYNGVDFYLIDFNKSFPQITSTGCFFNNYVFLDINSIKTNKIGEIRDCYFYNMSSSSQTGRAPASK